MLNELAQDVLAINKANGWGDKPHEVGTNLMLIVSELAEAMEADRKGRYCNIPDANEREDTEFDERTFHCSNMDFKEIFEKNIKDRFEDEIADTIIRCLDLCARHNIDIDFHVRAKMEYNKTRGYHHGGKAY